MRIKGQTERTFAERLAALPFGGDVLYGLTTDGRWYAYWKDAQGYSHQLYLGVNNNPQVAAEMTERTKIRCSEGHDKLHLSCISCLDIERFKHRLGPIERAS